MFFKLGPEYKWQRDLLRLLVMKEITLKYKRAYLGVFWSLLNPILTAAVYFFAFKVIMRFKMPDYSLFLLSALFPWIWFSASISMCTGALTANVNLIKKVLFPRHYFVLATIAGQFVTFFSAIPIIIGLVYYYGRQPGLVWLYGIPLLTLIQFAIIYGIGMTVAIMNAYFRDMQHLIGICLNLLFWLTPIIYPLETVPPEFRPYMSMNPALYLIQSWRDLVMKNTLDWKNIAAASAIAQLLCLFGGLVFNRFQRRLDEVL